MPHQRYDDHARQSVTSLSQRALLPGLSGQAESDRARANDILEFIASIYTFAQTVHPVAWRDFADAAVYLSWMVWSVTTTR